MSQNNSNLPSLSLVEAARGLQEKKFSSVELLESILARRDKVEPKIGAFLSTLDEQAKEQAKKVDQERAHQHKLPALAGLPIAIKDNFNLEGSVTTAASKILENFVSPFDATAVAKLKKAGALLVGKTNLDEFAMGSSTERSAYHLTHNPWDLERVPGGSSGGSAAAVAADECLAALGSDTGGSVRQPASFTGTVGLKPTYGRISRYGLLALASSLDVVGTLTKTVADAALLLETLAGEDPLDSTCSTEFAPQYTNLLHKDIAGLKIGIAKEMLEAIIEPGVEKHIKQAIKILKGRGAKIVDVSLPHTKDSLSTYYIIMPSEASANLARYDGIRYGQSIMRSKTVTPKNLLEVYIKSRSQGFGEEPQRRIMLGTYTLSQGYYDAYYRRAQKVRTLIRRDFDEAFKVADVLLTPTTPTPAFKIGAKIRDPLAMYAEDIMTSSVNIAGVPALSVPCGFVDGLPIGMQLIGPAFNEELLFALGHAYQEQTDWHTKKPALE